MSRLRFSATSLFGYVVLFGVITWLFLKVMNDPIYINQRGTLIFAYVVMIVLLCVTGYFYWKLNVRESFDPNMPKFMTMKETASFLYEDRDGYVATMSHLDLFARGSQDPNDYCKKIAAVATDFTDEDKRKLLTAVSTASKLLTKTPYKDIDLKKACYLPWVFAKTRGLIYEDGLPHTRADIIFLNENSINDSDLVNTLVHEKIHIYQRAFPEEMSRILEQRGYTRWKLRTGEPRIRANPDLDPWIYFDRHSEVAMAAYYTSDKPSSIGAVTLTSPAFEHPYEAIAYEVAASLAM